jgi:hypothetical protein
MKYRLQLTTPTIIQMESCYFPLSIKLTPNYGKGTALQRSRKGTARNVRMDAGTYEGGENSRQSYRQQYAEMLHDVKEDIEMVKYRAEERYQQERVLKLADALNEQQKENLAKEIAEGKEEDARFVRYLQALRLIKLQTYGFSGN